MEQQAVAASNSLNTCHSIIYNDGLFRVGGSLEESAFPYQIMQKMILPANHHFTKFVVSAEHIRVQHFGPLLLTASLRERYWIPSIRNLVRTVIDQCLTRYRFKAQATQQLMGDISNQHEYNLSGHSSLQVWTMLDQYHLDWDHHVAKP